MSILEKLINKIKCEKYVKFVNFENFFDDYKKNVKIVMNGEKLVVKDVKDAKNYLASSEFIQKFEGLSEDIYRDVLSISNSVEFSSAVGAIYQYVLWYLYIYQETDNEYRSSEEKKAVLSFRFDKLREMVLYTIMDYVAFVKDEDVSFTMEKGLLCEVDSKCKPEIKFMLKLANDINTIQQAINEESLDVIMDIYSKFIDGTYCIKHLEGVDIFEL